MRVTVTIEYRLEQTPDGAVWTGSSFAYPFWSRYLDVFDAVQVVARALPVPAPRPRAKRVDGEGVTVAPLPHYVGSWRFATRWAQVRAAARAALAPDDALIVRLPSPIAAAVVPRQGNPRPFGAEVVGDPREGLARGVVRDAARPVARWLLTRQVASLCRRAAAVSYVTAERLQRRYPPGPGTYATNYSSIDLGDEAFAAEPREPPTPGAPVRLVTVASLETRYKGIDVLLDAAAQLVDEGTDVGLLLVGDGRSRPAFEERAARLGIAERVEFRGEVPAGAPVRAALDEADLFVMPSRSEGLPRALIEAMARGMPGVGTTAGGIPELLDDEALVPPGDATALAGAIRRMLADPAAMAAAARRNLSVARDYAHGVLQARRREFYEHIRAATAAWLDEEARRSESSI